MRKTFRVLTCLSLLLIFSLGNLPLAAQQQPQRERRVAQPANAQPTPTPRPLPALPAASPAPTETPEEVPQAAASPTPDTLRTSTTTRTLPELQARIAQVLQKTELEPAMVGIKVTSL